MTANCPACAAANRDAARYCKRCGVQLAPSGADALDDLIGMQEVRQDIARLRLAMEAVRREGLTYSDRLHSIVIGNAGSGKSRLVHALASLYHQFGVIKARAPIICDAVDYADFSKKFQDNFKNAKGHVLCIENAQKLIPADYAERVEQIDRLISEMSKPANRLDPIIVLSGHPQRLREFLSKNDGVKSQFPFVYKLPDFTSNELADLTEAELRKGGFGITAQAKDKLAGVFKLILKNNRTPGYEPEARNAWAAVKMAETLRTNYLVGDAGGRSGARTISERQILQPTEDEKSVEQILSNFDQFVGMHALKQAVRNLVDEISVQRRRAQAGAGKERAIAFHMVLTGNPGTGKTTVARILGQIFRAIGVLEIGHVIEADRSKMVAGYVGQTAPQVGDLCDRALGGILFIDEAYALKQGDSDSFGQEAIDTLLKRMEDDRGKFVVIIAGYPKEIRSLLNSNPGLQSRFDERYRFHLDDYTADELLAIFRKLVVDEGYRLGADAEQLVRKHFVLRCAQKDRNFGNGREARNLFDACLSLQRQRLARSASAPESDRTDLNCIEERDVPAPGPELKDIPTVLDEVNRLIGLNAVKTELRALISYIQAEKLRAERGGKETQLSLHFVFRGNPGTGKTTVARIVADVFKVLGLLPRRDVKEVDRSGLVGNHIGDTALKVNALIDDAMGGVLFIDEAYSLLGDAFGTEAINTLLKRMEDDRGKFIVIAAGYFREMDEFLNSNSGLKSRFTKFIDFEDYEPVEMTAIYQDMVSRKGMVLDPSGKARAAELFQDIYARRDRNFANGRTVRNIFEKTLQNQAARIAPLLGPGEGGADVLDTIIGADITE